MSRRALAAVLVAGLAAPSTASGGGLTVVITNPPPGSQSALASAAVDGVVVGNPGPAPLSEVFIRTRYQDATMCPPINKFGAYDESVLGWGHEVEWDELTGVGTFSGRARWLDAGTNWIDIYLPTDTIGSPSASQSIVYQPNAVANTDIVVITHPLQRTVDVQSHDGSVGAIDFRLDVLNTTNSQSYTVDLLATMELPDGTIVDLPMGGPGVNAKSVTVGPGDFGHTVPLDPNGTRFTFPLDELPFPQPIQQGEYHMQISVYDGPALLFFEEDIDFWVSDNTGKQFRDVTNGSGLERVYLLMGGSPPMGNAVASFDYNNDGLTDLFFANPSGSTIFQPVLGNLIYPGNRNYLMRNEGDGTFTDVSVAAGIAGNAAISSYGVAWGDLNNDGWKDLVVCNRTTRMYVYRNNGDGTFTDIAPSSTGFAIPASTWAVAPSLGDVDDDGDLDLYVGHNLKSWSYKWTHDAWENTLWINELSEGNFEAFDPGWPVFAQQPAGPGTDSTSMTLGNFFLDYDRDGTLDLAVHNDFGGFLRPNQLFKGNGDGTFTDVTVASGYDVREFSMGAATADFDGDGIMDVYSSSIGRNSLLLGNGNGTFTQAIQGSGAEGDLLTVGPQADGVNLQNNWSVTAIDFDRDMDADLHVSGSDMWTSYNMPIAEVHPDSVYENDGTGQFTQVAEALGLANGGRSRGAVQIDYDNDGDMDLVVSQENEGVTLSRNDWSGTNNWIQIRPQETRSAPGAFNTFLTVTAGGVTQIHETNASSPHMSMSDNLVEFGLGTNTSAEIVAEWPRGGSTTVFDAAAAQTLLLYETVVEIDGVIDADVPADSTPTVRVLGRPGDFTISAVGDPSIPFPLQLAPGVSMDIFPLFIPFLFEPAFLDAQGAFHWNFLTMPASLTGLTLELQTVVYDIGTGTFPMKSGVSTLTVVP